MQEPASKHTASARGIFLAVSVLVLLLSLSATALITFLQPKVYAATARIEFSPKTTAPKTSFTFLNQAAPLDSQLLASQIAVLQSPGLLQTVVEELDLNAAWGNRLGSGQKLRAQESVRIFRSRLELQAIPGTMLLQLRAFSESPKEAAEMVNTLARTYSEGVNAGAGNVQVRVAESAVTPLRAVRPDPAVNFALGTGIGLIVGIFLGALAAKLVSSFRQAPQPPQMRADDAAIKQLF